MRVRPARPVMAVLLAAGIAALNAACAGSFEPPAAIAIEAAPSPVLLVDLENAYRSDAAAADAEYKGKRLYFKALVVEKVSRQTNTNFEDFVMAGGVKFKPEYYGALEMVTEGTVVDIVGDCCGQMFGCITFRDCWINIVGGPTAVRAGY